MKALVTGGGGFLGRAICEHLVRRGDSVRSFARGDYPELTALGVEHVRGDIEDSLAVRKAAEGVEVIFHVAAKPGIWGSRESFYGPNVRGTENVIAACRAHGIAKLVHTSSPSVVFGGRDLEGVNESTPFPDHFEALYPETKALSERAVLGVNDARLATVALRPHLIWGPRDNHLVPRVIDRGRKGQLRRLGSENKKVDCIYIDNCAEAHLHAADRLAPGSRIAGKVYFLSNDDPRPLWDLVNGILAAAGLPPVTRSVPVGVAKLMGGALEVVHGAFGLQGEPRMTRFLAGELSTAHWFDISAAKRDLEWKPRVSIDEGLKRLAEWLRAGGR